MHAEVVDRIDAIPAAEWNALAGTHNPFLSHEFLCGLEQTACVCHTTGWEPQHLALYGDQDQRRLLGAAPLYLKHHSYGEYVFDWAWADAYRRAGRAYYPKLLSAVPFTPVTGARLLVAGSAANPTDLRRALIEAALARASEHDVSSLHWLFTTPSETTALEAGGLLRRVGNQFHWHNRDYLDFDHYLAQLSSKRRKQIRRERRRVIEAGVAVDTLRGEDLQPRHWEAMYRFYARTVAEHGAIPYLNRDFFDYLAAELAPRVVLFLARRGGRYLGGAMNLAGDDALFGRYWGALEAIDCLHFELCYYRPIEYCIDRRLARFEAGAQGEHKLSRGLLPSQTLSAHWLKHGDFAAAVADFLHHERRQMSHYTDVLYQHSPFRREL